MPGVLLPNSDAGWLRADAADLDRKLREGDGIQWSGDPSLYLGQGLVEETRGGRPTGKIVARRWEVWRYCEDGVERLIGHWRMEDFDRICYDLARMRAEAPGHEDVIDAIERHEKEAEERVWQPYRESMGEMMEHMTKLWHDRNNPRNTFRGMPGSNPDKQL
jgi:hypothetical protein